MRHRGPLIVAAVIALGFLAGAAAVAASSSEEALTPSVATTPAAPEQDPYLAMSPVLEGPAPTVPISPCILDCHCGGPEGCGPGDVCGVHANGSPCFCGTGARKRICS